MLAFLREEDISEKAAASILEGAAGEAGKGLLAASLGEGEQGPGGWAWQGGLPHGRSEDWTFSTQLWSGSRACSCSFPGLLGSQVW